MEEEGGSAARVKLGPSRRKKDRALRRRGGFLSRGGATRLDILYLRAEAQRKSVPSQGKEATILPKYRAQ